ncbi:MULTISPECIES: dephospho-CoA kinase [unclassified Psychrobacter]|uniref:dephospho-CoA kinase n=1 Tax=unclassified Psychrobacter TaxID=196806 RepID=UPI00078CE6AA|nr:MULTISPECIES: dephospho-CoA kinase [unclassified Psychrobacter]AMN48545.1 dephospho-CoA kinase [Psychrobacter sp. P2G3]AMN66370.1 dephospho-CoA kinase [Psychrobacter sp. P11G5]
MSIHSKKSIPQRQQAKMQNKTLVIGLTGGIGSGKSAASDWFAAQGIDIIDADVIAHEVVAKGSPTLYKIQKKLGDWVVDAEGNMDRAAVRTHVFANPAALIKLEEITHPAIRETAKKQLAASTSPYIILSAPLLIEAAEAGLANLCQRILVIDADEDTQLARASLRDEQSMIKIKAIMANQLDRTERNRHADDLVVNEEDLASLHQQLEPLHQNYLKLAQQLKYAAD